MPGSDNNTKIVEYWSRRPSLTEAEWVDFNRSLVPFLLRTRLPEEYSDPVARLELINDFFQDKVLINAETSKAGQLVSAYALHGFLKNYALDQHRKGPDKLPDSDSSGNEVVEPAAEPTELSESQLLFEAGIDVRAAIESADAFIANALDDGDRAYLRHASCTDGEPEPVSRIAKRLNLGTAFFFRAKKLGITRSKGDTYRGYEQTKIGAWLLSTGAQLHPDWRAELAALLIVLCHQVRRRVRGTS